MPLKRTFSLLALCLWVCAATAQTAYTTKTVNLRSGPDRTYPVVAVLSPHTPLAVQGCLADFRWCDVIAGGQRGWLYAGNIELPYEGGFVPLREQGAQMGVAVVSFVFIDYWGEHYRHYPWFGDHDRWAHPPAPPPRHVIPPVPAGDERRRPPKPPQGDAVR